MATVQYLGAAPLQYDTILGRSWSTGETAVVDAATAAALVGTLLFSDVTTSNTAPTSKQVKVFGPYADTTTLQAAYPAAANTGNVGLVGASAPYTRYISDGSTWAAGGGGTSTIAGATDYSTASLPTDAAAIALKQPKALAFNAATGVATKADSTTFTPVSSTAPPAGCEVLVCTTTGTLPTPVDGISGPIPLNDGLEWVGVVGKWVWNKSTLATSDLSNGSAVPLLSSTQQTQVSGGATPALLNSGKTGLKDPAGGADITLGGEQHISNYTASATQTGVSTESAALMSLSLPILPAGASVSIKGAIIGNSDAGTTTIRLKFGTTTIGTFANGTGQTANTFVADIDCIAAASQWLTGAMRAGTTTTDVESNNTSVDTSTAPTLNATLQNSTTTRTSQIAFLSVRVKLS